MCLGQYLLTLICLSQSFSLTFLYFNMSICLTFPYLSPSFYLSFLVSQFVLVSYIQVPKYLRISDNVYQTLLKTDTPFSQSVLAYMCLSLSLWLTILCLRLSQCDIKGQFFQLQIGKKCDNLLCMSFSLCLVSIYHILHFSFDTLSSHIHNVFYNRSVLCIVTELLSSNQQI